MRVGQHDSGGEVVNESDLTDYELFLEDAIRHIDRELRICGLGGVREYANMVRYGDEIETVLTRGWGDE